MINDINNINKNSKICLLLSGGVDSAVSLHLLCEAGFNPDCWYIKIGPEQEEGYSCNSDEDIEMCQWLTKKYNCKFDIINCHKDYWDNVTKYTMDCVKKGLTPNPDVMCNKLIKFGVFEDKVGKNYDYIATGHYAQNFHGNGFYHQYYQPYLEGQLFTSPDPVKDQTDFLCQLNKYILAKIIFPIGHLYKEEVRKIAEENNLINKNRKDSQGICFLGKINYNDYIRQFLGEKEGDFIEYETGKVLGKHKGYWFHTLGQRKGITINNGPWYVVKKDIENNIVYISHNKYITFKKHHKNFYRIYLNNDSMNFFGYQGKAFTYGPANKFEMFKIRHSPELYRCKFLYDKDKQQYCIEIHENVLKQMNGIAPGQFCCIYESLLIDNPKHEFYNPKNANTTRGFICSGEIALNN